MRPEKHEVDLVYEYAEHDLADIVKFNKVKQQTAAANAAAVAAASGVPPSRVQAAADIRLVKSILWQILQGVAFLHRNWVMHRDIKPANILVTGEKSAEPGRVKIGQNTYTNIYTITHRTIVICHSYLLG